MEIVWTDLAIETLSDIVQYVQSWFGRDTASDVSKRIIAFVDTLSVVYWQSVPQQGYALI